ncbi:MAG: AraC family transcriptional regulator [Clostridiales bacterium]|nr:AraC family transcriptional regulator [Clostridiales bacterium]
MNDMELYEKIPEEEFPIRLLRNPSSDFRFAPHWHEHTEIHFIFEGTARIKCADKLAVLNRRDCFIVNGNELHEGVEGNCNYGCIILPPSFFEKNHVIFKNIIRDETVSELMVSIFSEFENADEAGLLAIKGYTYLLVSHLIRCHSEKRFNESNYRRYFEKLDRINSAVKYISENYADNITTAELAGMVHMSEGHFCHVFKEVMGSTAKEYLNSIRIKKAKGLLEETAMTVTEAAYCCGFSDANYFARIFKKYEGTTPKAVRGK